MCDMCQRKRNLSDVDYELEHAIRRRDIAAKDVENLRAERRKLLREDV